MTAQEIWDEYRKSNPIADKYDAWSFGSSLSDQLANLVLQGIKTSTSSAYQSYLPHGCPLPLIGEYNVILNSINEAVCITKTIKVTILPFNQVPSEHAFKEGEGDRSLVYWRKIHKPFFTQELRKIGEKFSEEILVVCEEFELVYPKKSK